MKDKKNNSGGQLMTPQYNPYDYSGGNTGNNANYTAPTYQTDFIPCENAGVPVVPTAPQKAMSTGRKVAKFVGRSAKLTIRYIFARLLVCIIMGIALSVIFRFLNYPHPVLFGILECVGNFIPIIGEWIATLGICIPVFLMSEAKINALWVLLILFGLEIMDNVVLTPIIVGKSMQFKPIVVMLLTIIIAIVCGNVLGVLFAIPIAATVKLAYDIFWLKKSFDDPSVPK